MIYRMAYAIHCDRKDQAWEEIGGFLPSWCGALQLAEIYKTPEVFGVDFTKYVWWRRALIWIEAKNKSYRFENKNGD